MLLLLALVGLSYATPAEITLNEVDITGVREQRFRAVDVYIDEQGRVHITSDRYRVQVEGEAQDPATGTGGAHPGTPQVSARPPRIGPSGDAASQPARSAAAARAAEPARAADPPVDDYPSAAPPPGSYWLATEDNGTTGHTVDVRINGTIVRTVRSGEPQVIADISRYLRHGTNFVSLEMHSEQPTGRTLFVYLGEGSNEGGTVSLGEPEIQQGLGSNRQGRLMREFELIVD